MVSLDIWIAMIVNDSIQCKCWWEITFQVVHHIAGQGGCGTYRCMHKVHRFPELWWSSLVGHNCHAHGRTVLCGKSALDLRFVRTQIRNGRYHWGKHAAITPHIKAIIIFLEVDQQLRSLKVSRGHTNIVFRLRVVELGKAPVNETQLHDGIFSGSPQLYRKTTNLAMLMIDHNVVRLNIAMHDALRMTIIKRLHRGVPVSSKHKLINKKD